MLAKQHAAYDHADLIIPIPLHRNRLLSRRFNQAALMAKNFSKETGIPVKMDLLTRVKNTQSQGHLSPSARKKNLRNAFDIPKLHTPKVLNLIQDKSIILIDDVFTTGSTVEEAAKCLKQAGARQVLVFTIARVIRPHTPVF